MSPFKKIFLQVALPTPLRRFFDYLPPEGVDFSLIKPGLRIKVPFQRRTMVGLIMTVSDSSTIPLTSLKKAYAILDHSPIFPADVFKLCHWAADYYHHPIGEIFSNALPVLLRKGHPLPESKYSALANAQRSPHRLNEMQQAAIRCIHAARNEFKVILLNGVTGSGKTEVYLQSITSLLAEGKQVILLVPEISLTPQTINHFRQRFKEPSAIWHSGLSDKERLTIWAAAKRGDIKIIIGTRSAIFIPFTQLGLILVDEEHDASYKQQDRFRYHARDLAVVRAQINHIPIVLGSATPSLESLFNVTQGRYLEQKLPQRVADAALPQFEIVNLNQGYAEEGLSSTLITRMQMQLNAGNQVMLFLNRRGFAPVYYCVSCHEVVRCNQCERHLVYHQSPLGLQCHQCDTRLPLPTQCVACGQPGLQPVGLGTQRIEKALKKIFRDTPIIRLDKDTTRRKGTLQTLLADIHDHPAAILLGTQLLAKGHHFPRVTLVGILDADNGLFSTDFRAAEQLVQLLFQVAGRAGRELQKGLVLLQTHQPNHPLIQSVVTKSYDHVAKILMKERQLMELPPFIYHVILKAEGKNQNRLRQFLLQIKNQMTILDSIQFFGPYAPITPKRRNLFCEHLMIKATKRLHLKNFLVHLVHQLEGMRLTFKWSIDVDPLEH